jgi:hypothetical protein
LVLLDFSCSYTSPELWTFSLLQVEEQWNYLLRVLLKVRWTVFIRHCLTKWRFSIHLCSRICWFEDMWIESINQGNTRWFHAVENPWTLSIYSFCIATQLQFRFSSTIADISNAEWLKYHWFNLCCRVNIITAHPWPYQNSSCTCRLPRHLQDRGYTWSTPGALPLATTFKCKSVAQATSLSRSEPLASAASATDGSAAAKKEAATGKPDGGRQNNELVCSGTNVSCFCHECAAFKFKRASRVQAGQQDALTPMQAGRPSAGRKKQLHSVCTQTYDYVQVCALSIRTKNQL